MKKYLHNRIAENILTIYVCAAYGVFTWIIAGLFTHQLWGQFACMCATGYMMVEMNRHLILLRIRSWMMTSVFIMLTACCGFNYESIEAGIIGLCTVFAIYMLLLTYQIQDDVGHTYYAFLAIGVSSLFVVHILVYIPVVWLLTRLLLQSLNWRTWAVSLIGIATPYWFAFSWYIYHQDIQGMTAHFQPLFDIVPVNPTALMPLQVLVFILVTILTVIGAVHFWSTNFRESIRTRMFYYFLQWTGLFVGIFIILQPQYFNTLIRVFLICTSPFIAHFFTLTSSKVTNYLLFGTLGLVIILSMISINEPLLNYTNTALYQLWNGSLTF